MGFGVVGELIQALTRAIGLGDRPWGMMAVAGALMLLLLPSIVRNQHTGRARRLLQRAWASTRPAERAALEASALDEVRTIPFGLVVVADLCIEKGRWELAQEALRCLRASGKLPYERRRIELNLARDAPRPEVAVETSPAAPPSG